MSEAYSPNSLAAKIKRRVVRYGARRPVTLPPNFARVSFTFDDFPRSAGEAGARIVESFGYRATYYVATGFRDSENHLGALWTVDDLLRVAESGHEIGCHTHGHIDCNNTGVADVEAEAERNEEALRAAGYDGPLRSFAFPFGETSLAAKSSLSRRYLTLRSVWPGVNRGAIDCAYLRATGLDGGGAGVARARAQIADVKQNGGWLIFYGHDVQDQHSEWGASERELEEVVEAVAEAGLKVSTVGDVAQSIIPEDARRAR